MIGNKISQAQKIAQNRPEVSEKKSKSSKITWNTPEQKKRNSIAQNQPETKKKRSASLKRANKREETKEKRSIKAKASWENEEIRAKRIEADKKWWQSLGIKEKMVKALKKGHNNPATKKKHSEAQKRNWTNPEYIQKQAALCFPTKPEIKLFEILNELYPNEWKYTGDFTFWINGKCPDFVNINGQKKIIELFGDYWHKGEDPEDRAKIFRPFGWDTLVVWERELKDIESVKSRIKKFHESKVKP